MPFELYMFKPGARSTPKVRRNQSSFKYNTGNASIDSFTSLRPNSPGLISSSNPRAQTMPSSPLSFGSSEQMSTQEWQAMEPPSPAYSRFPDPKEVMAAASAANAENDRQKRTRVAAPPVPEIPAFFRQDQTSSPEDAEIVQHATPEDHDEGFYDPLAPHSEPQDIDEHASQAALALHLPPNSVALIRKQRHESGISQIYDWKGNEISYTFGGIEHFQSMYEKEESGDEAEGRKRRGGAWRKMKGWSKRMKQSMSKRNYKTYEIEVWHRKLKN